MALGDPRGGATAPFAPHKATPLAVQIKQRTLPMIRRRCYCSWLLPRQRNGRTLKRWWQLLCAKLHQFAIVTFSLASTTFQTSRWGYTYTHIVMRD